LPEPDHEGARFFQNLKNDINTTSSVIQRYAGSAN